MQSNRKCSTDSLANPQEGHDLVLDGEANRVQMTIQGGSTNPELSVELIWVFVANIKVLEFAWFYCLFKFCFKHCKVMFLS